MEYASVQEIARKWGMSERSVRNYCARGRITGAFMTGKTWSIPCDAVKPARKPRDRKAASSLLERLKAERESGFNGGIYHRIQIDLTYNSNHIEGSRLSHDQTRYIFETHSVGLGDGAVDVDDIVETVNHFRCIDMVIDKAMQPLSEAMIKRLHLMLKSGTSDSRRSWFTVGDYKKIPNEGGGRETTPPGQTASEMRGLLRDYNQASLHTFDDLLDFHVRFERIHPFQDGNGRVGRLILFKECLRNGIVPFIITDELKLFYYRGLQMWDTERGYLRDTCLTAQDQMKVVLDYFQVPY